MLISLRSLRKELDEVWELHTRKTELIHCNSTFLFLIIYDFWVWGLSVWPLVCLWSLWMLISLWLLYDTVLYYTILYYTILYYTILHYAMLYYTISYCSILYHIKELDEVWERELGKAGAKKASLVRELPPHIYIYIYIMCMCVYIYIYIYIHRYHNRQHNNIN